MPLIRIGCDKEKCAFCDNQQCISPNMPHFTTPAEIVGEDNDGHEYYTDNDKYSVCDRFVKKG